MPPSKTSSNSSRGRARLGAALVFACGLLGCAEGDPRPDVLLIWIDTVRVDHMSLYGYQVRTTSELDALAEESVVFEQAITHVPQTLPSTASLFTSQPPARHGVRVNGLFKLPDSALTLAEVLAEHGYDTAGIASSFPLDPRHGTGQGFDHYDADFAQSILTRERRATPFQGRQHVDFEQRADEATDKALAWLDQRAGDAPFFLFVHYFDAHFPYAPPPAAGLEGYDGELAFADRQIGRLVAAVEARARGATPLVVVAGDHGELLTQTRPGSRHAGYLDEAVLRVPLMLRYPGVLEAARITEQVGVTDVAPTILALVGIPAPPSFLGESLLPVVAGQPRRAPHIALETLFWQLEEGVDIERFGMRTSELKYQLDLRSTDGQEERKEMLFDLRRDPEGRRNLVEAAVVPAEYAKDLVELRALTEAYRAQGSAAERLTLDDEVEEKLRSLGYLGGQDR